MRTGSTTTFPFMACRTRHIYKNHDLVLGLRYRQHTCTYSPALLTRPPQNKMRKMLLPEETRWLILSTWKAKQNVRKTAETLKLSKLVVHRWVRTYKSTGGVQPRAKAGRPTILKEQAKRRAVELLLMGEHQGADGVAKQVHKEGLTSTVVSKTTLIRGARSMAESAGTTLLAKRGPPSRSLSQDTKHKRLLFSKDNKATSFSHVMFTDRKKFLFSYPGTRVRAVEWMVKGSVKEAAAVNHPLSYNLNMGITKHGVTRVHEVAGTSRSKTKYENKQGAAAKNITAKEYQAVLQNTFLPEGRRLFSAQGMGTWIFQNDNDPAHKGAAAVIKLYNTQHGSSIKLLANWPPNIPDLNPIENVWAWAQTKVNSKGCKSFEEFQAAVDAALGSVPKRMLLQLFRSMPKRLARVVELGGGKTGY